MARRPSRSSGARPARVLRITAPVSRTAAQAPATASAAAVTDDDVNKLSIASLTLDTPLFPLQPPPRARRVPATPFHFLSLPSEIRLRIYEHYFSDINGVLDLGPDNQKRIHGRLRLMRVCKQVHDEATHFFYSTRTFRIFPTYPGKYFKSKRPLLSKLKPQQRDCITSLELRLGPGWNAPPHGWAVKPLLGLNECICVKQLNVFVECDPSDNAFKGFRRSEGFYEGFSSNLLQDVLNELPNVEAVQFDAYSSVRKSGAMLQALIEVANEAGLRLRWGPERGWTDEDEDERLIVTGVGVGMSASSYASMMFQHHGELFAAA